MKWPQKKDSLRTRLVWSAFLLAVAAISAMLGQALRLPAWIGAGW